MKGEMSFTERMKFYYKNFFDHYFNLSGRARRSEFWLITLFNFIIGIIGFICLIVPGVIWGLAIIIPGISLNVRRLHDRGFSGWWLIPSYIWIFIWSAAASSAHAAAHSSGNDSFSFLGAVILCVALICLLIYIFVFILEFLPSKKGENKYGFNPIEMENILHHFKAIETIYIGSSSMGQMGSSPLFAFIAELEQSKSLFKQIYIAKERLNRMMLLNGTIERIEHLRHEIALQPENQRILLGQLEQLENELRALPNPLLG